MIGRVRSKATAVVAACSLVVAGTFLALYLTKSGGTASGATTVSLVSYLFVQDAAGGTLRGSDDQHLTLTLTGVADWVTRFADRPVRSAQTVDIRDFLARWRWRFGKSAPNVVLSYRLPGDPRPRDIVLELTNPRYDRATATATYDARRIHRTTDTLLDTRFPRTPVHYPTPQTFAGASIFIDDAGAPTGGGCVFVSLQGVEGVSGIDCSGAGGVVQAQSAQSLPAGTFPALVAVDGAFQDGTATPAGYPLAQPGATATLSPGGFFCLGSTSLAPIDCESLVTIVP